MIGKLTDEQLRELSKEIYIDFCGGERDGELVTLDDFLCADEMSFLINQVAGVVYFVDDYDDSYYTLISHDSSYDKYFFAVFCG